MKKSIQNNDRRTFGIRTYISRRGKLLKKVTAVLLCGVLSAGMIFNGTSGKIYGAPVAAANNLNAGSVELRRVSGSGSGFMYYHFKEITKFQTGTTYALLDGVYTYEQAVTQLGSGAVLTATGKENNSLRYIRNKYGNSALAEVYVSVVTRGMGFDYCPEGGLYKVPGSGTPAEYRYFCFGGAARNCGPLYAYSYEKTELSYKNVSASLKSIDNRGSEVSSDYTVRLSYGNNGSTVILEPSNYSITIPDADGDTVIITVEDNDRNKITANFTAPLAICYEANEKNVTGLPEIQGVWKGEESSISSASPRRTGYAFTGWKSEDNVVYQPGKKLSPLSKVLHLYAQWKDTKPPEFTYIPVQVATRTSDEEIKEKVKEALTITDNEPVSECRVTVSGSNIAVKAGSIPVTVTVTDKAGNKTVKEVFVDVTAMPVEFRDISFDEGSGQLKATLYEPGSDIITETGFVWGIMNNPTTVLHNGQAHTSSPVTAPNGKVWVNGTGLSKGVTYYARPYAIADGVTYYGNEISFGLDLPAYGTFSIKNNGNNTFTVTRANGTAGKQTVYYRTVNGSAVGGTHFTHKAETLVFNDGESSKTITVNEAGVEAAYNNKTATAYSNGDRTYEVELYRITGGGNLGTVKAVRTMNKNTSYTVDRNIYSGYKEETNPDWWGRVTDSSYFNSPTITFSMSPAYGSSLLNAYIKNTSYAQALYLLSDIWEEDDGNQHIRFTASEGYTAEWKFEIKPGDKGGNKRYNAHFPCSGTTAEDVRFSSPTTTSDQMPFISGEDYLQVPISVQSMKIGFDASGSGSDDWRYENTRKYTKPLDNKEPSLLGVAPMAGGIYKTGDTFTVSLVFDEIVDRINSSGIEKVTLNTTWGIASYSGGADTNVLYFRGSVTNGAGSSLQIRAINNAGNIKDMCNINGTASGGSGSVTAAVDTASPEFTLASKGISGGTGTVNITVNGDKSKTTSMKYVWSDSSAMPAAGWVTLTTDELNKAKAAAGLSAAIRKEAGSGRDNGKWYLHVIGTYDTTGATTYKSLSVDFGTKAQPAQGSVVTPPSLEVSADNGAWAVSRKITISASGGDSLKYRLTGKDWVNLNSSAGSVTVTENGYYTFLMTAGDRTITKSIRIEKIDRINPVSSIGGLLEEGTEESEKAGVYTRISLPIAFSDGDSGVKTVQYAWTGSAQQPSSWSTLEKTASRISYTATENTETTKYLHLKVTDNVGNISVASSLAYKVISSGRITQNVPEITLKGAPLEWTNDAATLEWELTGNNGRAYPVTLPNGRTVTATSGNFLVTSNGTYTVTVHDNVYGGDKEASLTVDKLDLEPPKVSVGGVKNGFCADTQRITITPTDSQSGAGKGGWKIVESTSEIPDEESLTDFSGSGKNIDIDMGGIHYIYYRWYDNAGDESLGRKGNMTEGFAGPVKIDKTNPQLNIIGGTTGAWADDGLKLTLQAVYGASGGTAKINGNSVKELNAGETDGKVSQIKSTEYTITKKGLYTLQAVSGAGKGESCGITVYRADFYMENGTKSQLAPNGGALQPPSSPVKEGYEFDGWKTSLSSENIWDFSNDRIAGDTTLYPSFSAKEYTISFDYNGATAGSEIKEKNVIFDETYGTLPKPEKTGCNFAGWYMDGLDDTEITETTKVTTSGVHTLHARWSSCDHEWDLENVSVIAPGCTEEGTKTFICKKCKDTKTEKIDMIGHKWSDWISNGDGTHTRICANDNLHTETGDCLGGAPTHTKRGECEICGGEYGDLLPDTTAPTGTINIGADSWSSFLNTVAFEHFYRDPVTVTVDACDDVSGVASVSYYVSDKVLSAGEVITHTEWTEGDRFIIEPDLTCVVYVRIQDNEGNTAYISSDGLVIDGTAPRIMGAADEGIYCLLKEITVTDNNPFTVMVNGEEVLPEEGKYIIRGAESAQIIKAADILGNESEITVSVNTGHTPSEGTVTKPPTETEPGIRTYFCTICGCEIYKEDIPVNKEEDNKPEDSEKPGEDNKPGDSEKPGEDNKPGDSGKPGEGNNTENNGSGEFIRDVELSDTAPRTEFSMKKEELSEICLTDREKELLECGSDVKILLTVTDAGKTVNDWEKQSIVKSAVENGYSIGQYLDINLFKIIGGDRTHITQTKKNIRLVIAIPDSLKKTHITEEKVFAIARIHDGKVTLLEDEDDNRDTVTISTDRFSTYAIIYRENVQGDGGSSKDNTDKNPAQSDTKSPLTSETAPLELFATLSMITGLLYLLVYFRKYKKQSKIR